MDIKKFQSVCRFAQILLLIALSIYAAAIILFSIFFFRESSSSIINMNFSSFSIIHSSSNSPTELQEEMTALIVGVISLIILIYTVYKGSQLFGQLANGNSPFSIQFSKQLKIIGIILIVADVIRPLFYSVMLTTLMDNGYYFILHLSSAFIFGIILYCMAEILNYGMELQNLSDYTV